MTVVVVSRRDSRGPTPSQHRSVWERIVTLISTPGPTRQVCPDTGSRPPAASSEGPGPHPSASDCGRAIRVATVPCVRTMMRRGGAQVSRPAAPPHTGRRRRRQKRGTRRAMMRRRVPGPEEDCADSDAVPPHSQLASAAQRLVRAGQSPRSKQARGHEKALVAPPGGRAWRMPGALVSRGVRVAMIAVTANLEIRVDGEDRRARRRGRRSGRRRSFRRRSTSASPPDADHREAKAPPPPLCRLHRCGCTLAPGHVLGRKPAPARRRPGCLGSRLGWAGHEHGAVRALARARLGQHA